MIQMTINLSTTKYVVRGPDIKFAMRFMTLSAFTNHYLLSCQEKCAWLFNLYCEQLKCVVSY